MRKWALRIGTFLLGIVLGLGANLVGNLYRPLSLCDLDANPEKYAGQIVRLRVYVFNEVTTGGPVPHGPRIAACSICAGDYNWPDASVDLDSEQLSLVPEHVQHWIREHEWEEGKSYVTEAVLVGRFEPPDGITHCFSPKYHLSQARIERVIASHVFENTEHLIQWMDSKSGVRRKS
jgi:hypothetical protein